MKAERSSRWLSVVVMLAALSAGAQALDASVPVDADAGTDPTGMRLPNDNQNQSEENNSTGPCAQASDCEGATTCVSGRCVPRPIKKVGGCGGTASWAVLALGLTLLRRR